MGNVFISNRNFKLRHKAISGMIFNGIEVTKDKVVDAKAKSFHKSGIKEKIIFKNDEV